MSDSLSKKTKLLTYLKENKIRKDWLAGMISKNTGIKISKVELSHYLHGRRALVYFSDKFIESEISKILEVPKDEIF